MVYERDIYIFWEALRRRYQRWAKRAGHATTRVETGAVTGVHRAGASLNVHVHCLGLDVDTIETEDVDKRRWSASTRAC